METVWLIQCKEQTAIYKQQAAQLLQGDELVGVLVFVQLAYILTQKLVHDLERVNHFQLYTRIEIYSTVSLLFEITKCALKSV